MVTVFLRGGLGNQMFQYAAGLSVVKKKGDNLSLDTVFLNDRFPRKNFTYRTYDLDIFSFNPQLSGLSRASKNFPIPGVWLGVDLVALKLKAIFGNTFILKEDDISSSDKNIAFKTSDVVLWGFWQSEKYFEDVVDDVRAAFTFRDPLNKAAALFAQDIHTSESVAIHVRRGDYLLGKYKKLYGITDVDYYNRAIANIGDSVKDPHFFVFSDDIDWCKENIKTPYVTTYMDAASSGPKSSYHLQLMSLCKHNIIANSSFSWWGAWLNKNPQKIVIAPKQWHVGMSIEENDVTPANWIKL